ncbi:MAG: DivIVA domain-containing protein [Candidatus Hydrogenedentes bacterium]|nr:DivIVA domain-containing protein [Candidatus Hydrogenedentota bacterium]
MEKNKVMEEVLGDTPDLTVSDLYSADFKTVFRGYDKQRVNGFLARVADAFEVLQREVTALRKSEDELRFQVDDYREMEKSLTAALAGAQKLSETTLAQAKREADVIVEEARVHRDAAKAKSAVIPDELREEIAVLRAERTRLKADLRAVLDIHLALLRDDGGDDGASVEFMPDAQGSVAPEEATVVPDEQSNEDEKS